MRTISNGRIGIGLFKKLTPYIIIWLAGFGLQTPFKIKKIRLRGNSAGCRYTTDIICGPLRQEIKGRMPGRDRQSNKGRESEVERGRRERGKRERVWR